MIQSFSEKLILVQFKKCKAISLYSWKHFIIPRKATKADTRLLTEAILSMYSSLTLCVSYIPKKQHTNNRSWSTHFQSCVSFYTDHMHTKMLHQSLTFSWKQMLNISSFGPEDASSDSEGSDQLARRHRLIYVCFARHGRRHFFQWRGASSINGTDFNGCYSLRLTMDLQTAVLTNRISLATEHYKHLSRERKMQQFATYTLQDMRIHLQYTRCSKEEGIYEMLSYYASKRKGFPAKNGDTRYRNRSPSAFTVESLLSMNLISSKPRIWTNLIDAIASKQTGGKSDPILCYLHPIRLDKVIYATGFFKILHGHVTAEEKS